MRPGFESAVSLDEDSCYLLLLDYTVRSFDDLMSDEEALSKYRFAPRLVGKLRAAGQLPSLSEDKIFFSHDIGSSGVCHAAIARVPLLMYQKLDLARKVILTCLYTYDLPTYLSS